MTKNLRRLSLLPVMIVIFVFLCAFTHKTEAASAPSAVSSFKVSSVTTTTAVLSWNKADCKGYVIRYASGKAIKTSKVPSKTTYTMKNLTPGTQYVVKIKCFKYKTGTTQRISSPYTYLVFSTKPAKTTLKAKANDGSIELSWKTIDCDAYQLYRRTGTSGKYKKIATLTTESYTDENVTPGTKYYYKVRGYTESSSKAYGAFSSAKSATAKQVITSTMPTDKVALINQQTLTPVKTHDPELDSLISSIINSVTTSSMTKAEKLKACYDYLIYNCTYGYPSGLYKGKYSVVYSSRYDQSVYNYGKDTLNTKIGTCMGINSAFCLLARRLGFEAVLEGGHICSLGHYWVNIKLSGQWYLFDPQVEQSCYIATGYSYIANWCWCEDLYWPCKDEGFGSWYIYDDEEGYRSGFNSFKGYTLYTN